MTLRVKKEHIVLLVSVAILAILLAFHSQVFEWLRYSRADILSGELWRIFSCHFIHLNINHGIFNIVALIVIVYALNEVFTLLQWLFLTCLLCLLTSLGLLIFSQQVVSYVGLSGVLHGLFSVLTIILWVKGGKLYAILLLGLVIKIVREQLPGFDIYHMKDLIGGAVIVDGHLYGALAGGLLALSFLIWEHTKTKKRD